ncbi:hypothetical protein L798_00538 [Zootermopsis nevadensis]|uniref:Uncharacterized protein n=1 Tax=Zootermopsis nevadensis TaxID=136037 RepID=A0A067QL90_ZOONE|nr:hypothetical protein L798_00538 [Zootermopsis nevadensis]
MIQEFLSQIQTTVRFHNIPGVFLMFLQHFGLLWTNWKVQYILEVLDLT